MCTLGLSEIRKALSTSWRRIPAEASRQSVSNKTVWRHGLLKPGTDVKVNIATINWQNPQNPHCHLPGYTSGLALPDSPQVTTFARGNSETLACYKVPDLIPAPSKHPRCPQEKCYTPTSTHPWPVLPSTNRVHTATDEVRRVRIQQRRLQADTFSPQYSGSIAVRFPGIFRCIDESTWNNKQNPNILFL